MRYFISILLGMIAIADAYSIDLRCRPKHAVNFGWHFKSQKYNVFASENVPQNDITIKNVQLNDPMKPDAIYIGKYYTNRRLKYFKSGPDYTVYIEENGPYSLETWTYHTNKKRLKKLDGAPLQDTMIYTSTGDIQGGPNSATFLYLCTNLK